ncbi:hypothetical protein QBC35DRAFT_553722 [Podospora australis]|uniref:Zn(2)-C6 fungal-type domain-containing protein n=1 Tax=Podospora australis TaxID=1536484 RepID=A0AAN6X1E0_9PEZI|nr:hypothetical protein QBC35DRAFT_553722 [Podospora australis]
MPFGRCIEFSGGGLEAEGVGGTSPLSSGYEFPQNVTDSIEDADEAFWVAYNSLESDSATGGAGAFMPSPASNSLGSSWAVLGGPGGNHHLELSPPALSPLGGGEFDHSRNGPFSATSTTPNDAHFLGQTIAQDGQQYLVPGEFVFDSQQLSGQYLGQGLPSWRITDGHRSDFTALYNTFPRVSTGLEPQTFPEINFENLNAQTFQSAVDVPPWEPLSLRRDTVVPAPAPVTTTAPDLTSHLSSSIFIMDEHSFISPSPPSHHQYSPSASASPRSPDIPIKWEQELIGVPILKPKTGSAPIPIRKTNHKPSNSSTVSSYRVSKPRKASPTDANSSALSGLLTAQAKAQQQQSQSSSKSPSPTPSSSSSSGSSPSQGGGSQAKFLIVTPSTITAHAQSQSTNPHHQQTNPFECFEALRPSQRGRKGPLATDTKQSALQVRRKGACFCCHARKVRCDMERPCRNCVKLTQIVPQAVCWQFPDFLPVLFPDFIRGHFRKEEMTKFIETSIESFTVDGVERPCTVELYSGFNFSARLQIRAKFFTAKTLDVQQHWHLQVGRNSVDLQARDTAPIGLEMKSSSGNSSSNNNNPQRDELKRKVREYINSIVDEPNYASLVTEGLRHTDVPRKILAIIHDYANKADSSMIRRALSIYAMHFVLTRHLCLTPRTVADLSSSVNPNLIPQTNAYVTPRVLNRQIKAIIDDMLSREMQLLFENFSKSLKPKLRREWAPCLAAFLVLCLFMESVETAADTFVISENEIALRNHFPAKYKRQYALNINKEMENMPFKQFAFQFHQIYQTYSRDAATRSFNPLIDDNCFELGELDKHASEMVRRLRRIMDEDDRDSWNELDFLTADPILPNVEEHPYPRDIAFNYTGRLVSKFLLSFQQEKYIIGTEA